MDEVHYDDLTAHGEAESSATVKQRVNAARAIQNVRFEGTCVHCNADMTSEMIKKYCVLDGDGERILQNAFDKLGLSARAYTRILKVARTIADLGGADKISAKHVAEAVMYRTLDKAVR